jgi:transcriptional regulator GlxA family with amidase domain
MINVCVLLLDNSYATTAVLPAEVFHCAGLLWNAISGEAPKPRFRITTASLDGRAVSSPYAMRLSPQVRIADITETDVVIVPGAGLEWRSRLARDVEIFQFLRDWAARGAYIAGIGTGAGYLAEAGLLDGRQGTTHWAVADLYRKRYPRVDWHPEKAVTEDSRMLCSSSVYGSVELSLHLVEKFCGRDIAQQCAKAILVDLPRSNISSQGASTLPPSHGDDRIHIAIAYMERHYAANISVESLASQVHMSPRNFIRRFKQATGHTPGTYLQLLRIAIAKAMLEDGASTVQTVSSAVGYSDPAFFRAIFKRNTGVTPSEYRACSRSGTNWSPGSDTRVPVASFVR